MPCSHNHFQKKDSSSVLSIKILYSLSAILSLFLTLFFIPSIVLAEAYVFANKWGSEGSGNGQFDRCIGLAVDSSGNVYVGDRNNRIQKFDSKGKFLTKWGTVGTGNGQFRAPHHIAVDSSGNVYVADYDNHRVQKFDSNGGFIKKWGGIGTDNGQFSRPFGIAVDNSGYVYVSGLYNHRIQKFDSNGGFITKWGSNGTGDGQFKQPIGIAFDSSGNVFVADQLNHRIQKFSSTGAFLGKWGAFGTGDGQVNGPSGIAIDSSDNVYVAEWGNNRIQKFTASGGFITKWGKNGGGDGQFYSPVDVALDSSGNVYVPDCNNHRVQKFTEYTISHWKFDEGSGTTASDSEEAGNNGTIKNGASYVDGKFNKCLSFDGSNDYVDCGNDTSLNFESGDFSLEAWFYVDSLPGTWKAIISKGASGADGYGISISSSNRFSADIQAKDGTNQHVSSSASAITAGRWHYGAAVFDRDEKIYVYLDGKKVAEAPYDTGNNKSVSSAYSLKIGRSGREAVWFWDGKIDSPRVSNRALTEEAIKFEYENQRWYKYAGNPVMVGDSFEKNTNSSSTGIISPYTFIKDGDTYKLWYVWSAGSKLYLAYATSQDAVTWTKHSNFQLETSYNYSFEGLYIIKDGSSYKLWIGRCWPRGADYSGITLLESTDGENWLGSQQTPVTYLNHAYFLAAILKEDNVYKMWHSRRDGIWYLTSSDGITWSEYANNPVMKLVPNTEENTMQPTSIQKRNGIYYLTYTTANCTYLAYSIDGINWVKYTGNPIVDKGNSGAWDGKHGIRGRLIFDDDDAKVVYNGYSESPVKLSIGLATTTSPPLIAHYKFDEGSGTTATDSSGREMHGTVNGATYDDGMFGKALSFDGSDDYIEIKDSETLSIGDGELTVILWTKPEVVTGSTTKMLLTKRCFTNNNEASYSLGISNGMLSSLVKTETAGQVIAPQVSIEAGEWKHIALVYGNGYLKIYVDGRLEASKAGSGNIWGSGTQLPVCIGYGRLVNRSPARRYFFDGLIDDVKIFNTTLTADEIKHEYQGLVAYYKFDESAGTTAKDETLFDNEGTLKNGPVWQSSNGKYDGALKFDGTNDYVSIDDQDSLDLPGAQTICTWVNLNDIQADQCFISKLAASGDNSEGGFRFGFQNGNATDNVFRAIFRKSNTLNTTGGGLYGGSKKWDRVVSEFRGWQKNTWYHVTASWDGTTGTDSMKMYVNGHLDGVFAAKQNAIVTNKRPVTLGRMSANPTKSKYFKGLMDDFRIYRRALIETEIKEVMNNDYEPPTITLTEPDGTDDKTTESKPNYTIEWTDDDPDSDARISLYYTDKIWFHDDFEDGSIDDSVAISKSGGDITEHDGYLHIDSSGGNSQVAYAYFDDPLPNQYQIEIEYSVKKDNLFFSIDNGINPGNLHKRIEFPPSPRLLLLRYWTGSETKHWNGSSWVTSSAEILRDNTSGMTGKYKYVVKKTDSSYLFKLYDENDTVIFDTSSSPVPLSAVNGGTTPDYLTIGDDINSNVALNAQIHSLSIQSGTDENFGGALANKLAEPDVDKIDDLPSARRAISATAVKGKIYVIGGHDSSGGLKDILQINPSSGESSKIGELSSVRNGHGAAETGGKIYLCAGSPGEKKDVIEIDPLTGSETVICNLPSGREGPAAVAYEGKIYVIGGYNVSQWYLKEIIEVDPVAKTAVKIGDLPSGRNNLAAVTYNGKIYAIGGKNCSEIVEINPSTGEATVIGDLPTERSFLKAAVCGGKIIVIGGTDNSTGDVSDILEIDPSTGTATKIGDLPSVRFELAAAEYNGSVYAIGGRSNGASILFSDIIKIKIVDSISEDSTTDSYTWDTTNVSAGEYYILAKIKDLAHDPVWSVSPGKVKVKDFKFYEYSGNPILKRGSDVDYYINEPCVIKDDDKYKMWYLSTNKAISQRGISYAESINGLNWNKYSSNPVLVVSESYETQLHDLSVIKENGLYKMWYNASLSAAWSGRVIYATSPDGINWTKHGMVFNYTGSMGGHHDVIKVGNEYILYFYTAGWSTIRYATSSDGVNWTDQGEVVGKGASGEFDSDKIRIPVVVKKKNSYVMFYWGNDAESGSNGEVDWGYAESTDAKNWKKKGQVTAFLPDGSRNTVRKNYGCALYDNGVIKIWFDTGGDYSFGYQASSDNVFPTFTFTEPDGNKDYSTADDPNYTIKWTATDTDDEAKISIYYDDDNEGWDGSLANVPDELASKIGDMPSKRMTWSMAELDGKLYIAGGRTGNTYLSDILRIDPQTGQATKIGDLPSARGYQATVACGGKIYNFGGYKTNQIVEIDPATGSASVVANLPSARYLVGATEYNGKAYVLGGWTGGTLYSDILEFDPSDKSVTKVGDLPTARGYLGAATLNDKIYAVGGHRSTAGLVSEVLEIDPVTWLSTKVADLPTARNSFQAAVLEGKIYVVGGMDDNGRLSDIIEIDPAAGTAVKIGDLPWQAIYVGLTNYDGNLYAAGGWGSGGDDDQKSDILKIQFEEPLFEGTDTTYTWNTTDIDSARYYLYAKIDDGVNPPIFTYSDSMVYVNAPKPEIIVNPVPPLVVGNAVTLTGWRSSGTEKVAVSSKLASKPSDDTWAIDVNNLAQDQENTITLDPYSQYMDGDLVQVKVTTVDPGDMKSAFQTDWSYGEYTGTYKLTGDWDWFKSMSKSGGNTSTLSSSLDVTLDSSQYTFLKKWGKQGSGEGEFNRPGGIAVDSSGNIYITEHKNNHRIQKFSSDGKFIKQWGSLGTGNGQFNYPYCLKFDKSGVLYVVDSHNNRIQKLTADGDFITKWGSKGTGDGQFVTPCGIAIDDDGNIYICDEDNHRIQKFSSEGTFIAKWGSLGTGNGQFKLPVEIAIDGNGDLYVTDATNHRIQKFAPDGTFLSTWGKMGTGNGQFNFPTGIAIDKNDIIYVAEHENHRIQMFSSDGTFLGKFGEFGSDDGKFKYPAGIAFDLSGGMLVTEMGNYRVQKFGNKGELISAPIDTGVWPSGEKRSSFSTLSWASPAVPQPLETDANTLALWHFEADAKDASGNENDGTISGAEFVDGKFSKCLSFDGIDDYVDVGGSDSFKLNTFTIETWIKWKGGQGVFFSTGHVHHGSVYNYIFGIDEDGLLLFFSGGGYGFMYNPLMYSNRRIDDNWHHVAFTIDEDIQCLYIDGMLDSKVDASTIGYGSGFYETIVGMRKFNDDYVFNGLIDEMRISNIARTPEEIAQAAGILNPGIKVALRSAPIDVDPTSDDSLWGPWMGPLIFQDNFNDGDYDGWDVTNGKVENGKLVLSSTSGSSHTAVKDGFTTHDRVVTFDMKAELGEYGSYYPIYAACRVMPTPYPGYSGVINIIPYDGAVRCGSTLTKYDSSGNATSLGSSFTTVNLSGFKVDSYHEYGIGITGDTADYFIDGKRIHTVTKDFITQFPDDHHLVFKIDIAAPDKAINIYTDNIRVSKTCFEATDQPVSDKHPELLKPESGLILNCRFEGNVNGEDGESGTVSGVSYESGKKGKGVYIGAGDSLSFPVDGNISVNNGTIQMWVKPNWDGDDGVDHGFISINPVKNDIGNEWESGTSFLGIFKWRALSLFHFRIIGNAEGGASSARGGDVVKDVATFFKKSQWYHLTMTWEDETKVTGYINGVKLGEDTVTDGKFSLDDDAIYIGGKFNKAEAVIDDVKIYNYARTADQIAEDFASSVVASPTTWHIPVNPAHDGHRWLQYKTVLENVTPKVTPVLSSITINCREYVDRRTPDMSTPKITFIRMIGDGGPRKAYIMDLDGSNVIELKPLPDSCPWDSTPDISPDGRKFTLTFKKSGKFDTFTMNIDGSKLQTLTDNSSPCRAARWSSDGKSIVYMDGIIVGDYELFKVDVETKNTTRLTYASDTDAVPDWSPTGDKIAFHSYRDHPSAFTEVYTMNDDGSEQTRITDTPQGAFNPSWSPDGTKLAWRQREPSGDNYNIYYKDFNNDTITKLTAGYIDGEPDWSPDGESILFVRGLPGKSIIKKNISSGDETVVYQQDDYIIDPIVWTPVGTGPQTWYKYPGNPVLETGPGWRFDNKYISNCSVIKEDETYKMWYLGSDGSSSRVGYAESDDNVFWTVYQGSNAKYSVFDYSSSFRSPCVIKDGNKYKMWFFDSSHTIKMTTSDDGIEWDSSGVVEVFTAGESGKFDSNYVIDPRVIKVGEKYHMWYTGSDGTKDRTGYATSDDGIAWERQYGSSEKGSIMPLGDTGDFDSARTAHTPVVIYSNGVFMMWYYGHEGQYPSRIGFAYSKDGKNWTKVKGSEQGGAVLDAGAAGEFDDVAIWPWGVIKDEGIYKMWYGGEYNNIGQIGFARSKPYSATETAIAQDKTAPTMEDITEADNQWYKTGPTFSNFGFDDDVALDDAWYQMDGYTGSWSKLFEDATGKAWDKDGGSVFIGAGTGGASEPQYFETLSQGAHTVYFKADDDKGNVGGKNGEWSWAFKKDTQAPVTSYTITQGTKGKQNWYGQVPVNISLSAYDGGSGVSNSGGPDSTYYSTAGADPPEKEGTSFSLDEDGQFQPVFLSIDLAGNGEQINRSLQTVRVDLSAPQITVTGIEANSPAGDYLAEKEDAGGADRAFWFNGNKDMAVNVSVPWVDRYDDADSTANMDEIVVTVVETTQVLLMGSTGGTKAIMGSPAVCSIDMQGSSDTPIASAVTLDFTAYDYGGNSSQAAVALVPDNDGPEITLENPQYDTFKDRDGDPITFTSGANEYKTKKCTNGNDTIVLKATINDGSGSGAGRVTADLSALGGDEDEAFTEDSGTFELTFAGSTTESVTTTLPVSVSGYDQVENKADETVNVLLDNKPPKITLSRPDANAVDPRSLRTAVEVVFTIESDGPDSATNGCVPGSVRVVFAGKDPIVLPGKKNAVNGTYTVRIEKKIAGKDHGDTPVHELEDTVDGYGGDSYAVHVEGADWAGNWGLSNAVTFTYDEDCEELTEDDDIEDYQWSPDGEWIVYQRADGSVWCMKPDGSGLRNLVPGGAYNKLSNVTLSPDGRFLAFQGIDKKPPRTDIDVFVMNFDRDGDQAPDDKLIIVNIMKEVLVNFNGDPATNGVTKEISTIPGFEAETDNNILPQWKPLAPERDDPGQMYREPADGALLTQYAYQVSYHSMKSDSRGLKGGVFMRSAAGLQGKVDGSGVLIQGNLSGEIELFSERGFYRLETRWITPSDVLVQGTRLSWGGPAKPHLFLCQYDPRDASSNKIVHATPVRLPVAWQGMPAVKVLSWKHMQGAPLKRSRGNLPDGMASLKDIYETYGKKVFLAFQAGDRATGVSSLWKGVLIFRDEKQAKWGREFDIDVCRLKIDSVDGTVVRSTAGSVEESCLNPDFCPDLDWVVFERTRTVETGGKKEKVSRLYLTALGDILDKTGTGERSIAITSVIKKDRLGEDTVNYCFPKWCPSAIPGDGNYHHVMFKKVSRDSQTGRVKQNLAVIKVGE